MAANFYVSQFIWLRFKEERKMNGKKSAMEGFFESREKEKMQKMVRREIEVIHVY